MKAPAAFVLLTLLAAFHAPLVAASAGPRMDCCAGATEGMMCCPLSGSCSMRSCGADEREAALSTMSVFFLPGPAPEIRPAPSSFALAGRTFSHVSEDPPVLDPPPRV